MSNQDALAARLDAAHASGDDGEISAVYRDIAEHCREEGNTDGACFFWTQALVFALVAGDVAAESALRVLLAQHGRI